MSFVNPDFQTESILPFISGSFERNQWEGRDYDPYDYAWIGCDSLFV